MEEKEKSSNFDTPGLTLHGSSHEQWIAVAWIILLFCLVLQTLTDDSLMKIHEFGIILGRNKLN